MSYNKLLLRKHTVQPRSSVIHWRSRRDDLQLHCKIARNFRAQRHWWVVFPLIPASNPVWVNLFLIRLDAEKRFRPNASQTGCNTV